MTESKCQIKVSIVYRDGKLSISINSPFNFPHKRKSISKKNNHLPTFPFFLYGNTTEKQSNRTNNLKPIYFLSNLNGEIRVFLVVFYMSRAVVYNCGLLDRVGVWVRVRQCSSFALYNIYRAAQPATARIATTIGPAFEWQQRPVWRLHRRHHL